MNLEEKLKKQNEEAEAILLKAADIYGKLLARNTTDRPLLEEAKNNVLRTALAYSSSVLVLESLR